MAITSLGLCAVGENITVKMELLKSSVGAEPMEAPSPAEGEREGN